MNNISNDLIILLKKITFKEWGFTTLFDDDLTIFNDELDIEIDLIFDINKMRIQNYKTHKKDKIMIPKILDDDFEKYIKQFL